MSDLATEIALRLSKAGIAALLGVGLYLILVGPLGQAPSATLALLSWLSGAALLSLLASNPL
jgi:hypothetical protein